MNRWNQRRQPPPPPAVAYGLDDADNPAPPLRSIGPNSRTVADRTHAQLAAPAADAGAVFFGAVRLSVAPAMAAPAMVAGRLVVFVATVHWPPGCYAIGGDDRVYCDGVYTGQSVGPLRDALAQWRARLPWRHQVAAMVIVHPYGPGSYDLPSSDGAELEWAMADVALDRLRDRLRHGGRPSRRAVRALAAAAGGGPEGYR